MRLIHITPQWPPTVGGVADYAEILSRRLVEVTGGRVAPVLVHAGWQPGPTPEADFPAVDVSEQCSADALAEIIGALRAEASGPSVVLLEYSGYGYAKRGTPWWLIRGLKTVRTRHSALRLITVFHELYATGPLWASSFWLSPVQRYVAARLARLSDGLLTNRMVSADWLQRYMQPGAPLRVCPVFSNVGEPDAVPSWDEREPYAVVFGGGPRKDDLYANRWDDVWTACKQFGVERVVDVGPPPSVEVADYPVEVVGTLPRNEVSRWLRNATLGFLRRRRLDALTKSGVFAAYLAHGTLPVVDSDNGRVTYPGLETCFISTRTVSMNGQGKTMCMRARTWYREHAHSRVTARNVWALIEATNAQSKAR